MSDETVRPALTAEEWRNSGGSPLYFVTGNYDGTVQIDDRHALAALCLHGQPFGFTQEDVLDVELEAGALLRTVGWCPPGYKLGLADVMMDEEVKARAARLRRVADKMRALLPPVEFPSGAKSPDV